MNGGVAMVGTAGNDPLSQPVTLESGLTTLVAALDTVVRRVPAALPLAACMMLVAAGCQRDYQFKTTAVYRMTDARCTIRLETHGLVRAGADVSRDAEGQLIVQRTGAPPLRVPIVMANGDVSVEAARGSDIDGVVGSRLADAGCTPTPAERHEVLRALEGALAGPKGTLMDGQAKALKVTSVIFDR
jgi:hypothetical protein